MRKRAIGLNHRLPFANAIECRYDHRDLRSQSDRFLDVGIVTVVLGSRIVERKRGYRRPQYIHHHHIFGRRA